METMLIVIVTINTDCVYCLHMWI